MAKDVVVDTIAAIGPVSAEAREATRRRWASRAKLEGSLGRIEVLGEDLAAIRGTEQPSFHHKAILVFAGDHGVVEEGVSAYERSMTQVMLENLLAGGGAVNSFARFLRAELHVVDVGVDAPSLRPRTGFFPRKVARGTRNFAREPAMSGSQAREAVKVGMDVAQTVLTGGADLVAVGDIGVGNTTSAGAVVAALTGLPVERVVGPGIGGDRTLVQRKAMVIASALERHGPRREDAWEVMEMVGGFELAAMGGAYLACASRRVPVIVDGLTGAAAALWATTLAPQLKPYLIPSHISGEPGLQVAMAHLGLEPYFDFGFRHGEGTGAALQLGLCDLASRLLKEMVAFDELPAAHPTTEHGGGSKERSGETQDRAAVRRAPPAVAPTPP